VQHVAIVVPKQVGQGEVEQLLPRVVEVVAMSTDPRTVWRHPGPDRHIVEMHGQLRVAMPHADALVHMARLPPRARRTSPLVPDDELRRPRMGGETAQEPGDGRGAALIGSKKSSRNIADVDDPGDTRNHSARP